MYAMPTENINSERPEKSCPNPEKALSISEIIDPTLFKPFPRIGPQIQQILTSQKVRKSYIRRKLKIDHAYLDFVIEGRACPPLYMVRAIEKLLKVNFLYDERKPYIV